MKRITILFFLLSTSFALFSQFLEAIPSPNGFTSADKGLMGVINNNYEGEMYLRYKNNNDNYILFKYDGSDLIQITSPTGYSDANKGLQYASIEFNDTLFLKYKDNNGNSVLMKYANSNFEAVAIPSGFNGQYYGTPTIYNGNLYLVYTNSNSEFQLMKYSNGSLSLITLPAGKSLSNSFFVYKSDLIVSFGLGMFGPWIMYKYDGNSFTEISSPTGYDGFQSGYWGNPIVLNDTLFVRYGSSAGSGTLFKYDGTSLTEVSNPTGFNSSGKGYQGKPVIYNNSLYLQFRNDLNNSVLMCYNSASGELSDISTPINFSDANKGYWGEPVVYNSNLYLQYYKNDDSYSLFKFDGINLTEITSQFGDYRGRSIIVSGKLYMRYETSFGNGILCSYDGSSLINFSSPNGYTSSDKGYYEYGFPAEYNNKIYMIYKDNNSNFDLMTTAPCVNTSSSISPNACDSFTSPSGKYIWYSHGFYKDTISNYTGCDSIISITLTVSSNEVENLNPVSECDSAEINGNWYYSSQTVKDTIVGVTSSGCDSILVTELTILNKAINNSNPVTECDSAEINGKWYFTSQIVSDTIANGAFNGCDSIVITQLTINNTIVNQESPVVFCDSAEINGNWYYSSQTVRDTFSAGAANGCDSIVVTPLTINNKIIHNANPVSDCDSAEVNGNWYKLSQTVRDSFPNGASTGCDSIVVTELTIFDKILHYAYNVVECDSAEINGNWYYMSQTVRDSFPGGSVSGCDSVVVTELLIHSLCCMDMATVCQEPNPLNAVGMISDVRENQKVFDNFTGIVGGITHVEWWGSTGDGTNSCGENPKQFKITFYMDNNGEIGDIVSTYTANVTGVNAGTNYNNSTEPIMNYIVSLPYPTFGIIDGWISIEGNPAGNCNFIWLKSEKGDNKSFVEGGVKSQSTDDFAFSIIANPNVPIADWAIYVSIFMIIVFALVYRKIKI